MTKYPDLIARLEALTGPDRGADGRIAWALGWRFNGFIWAGDEIGGPDTAEDFDEWDNFGGSWKQPEDLFFYGDNEISKQERREGEQSGRWDAPPNWTKSLDAAVVLCERVLPGWMWSIDNSGPEFEGFVSSRDGRFLVKADTERYGRSKATPSIALLIAILKALDAKENADD